MMTDIRKDMYKALGFSESDIEKIRCVENLMAMIKREKEKGSAIPTEACGYGSLRPKEFLIK